MENYEALEGAVEDRPIQALVKPQSRDIATAATAVAEQMSATIRARYALAIAHPRDMDLVRTKLLKSCQRKAFAEAAIYSIPRGGKKVEGLSVRFAEEAARSLGNIAVESMIVHEDSEKRIVRVTATDIEANLPLSSDVMIEKFMERKHLKDGERAISSRRNSSGEIVHRVSIDEGELLVKMNREVSKAKRNLIIALLPADIADECKAKAKAVRISENAKDPDAARKALVDGFSEQNVTPLDLKAYLGTPIEQASPAQLDELRTIWIGIRDGEVTWRQIMAEVVKTTTEAADKGAAAPIGTPKTVAELKQKQATKRAAAQTQAASPAPSREPGGEG